MACRALARMVVGLEFYGLERGDKVEIVGKGEYGHTMKAEFVSRNGELRRGLLKVSEYQLVRSAS